MDFDKEVVHMKKETRTVAYDDELRMEAACHLRPLHEMVMKGTGEFKKEETLLFLLSHLIQNYG